MADTTIRPKDLNLDSTLVDADRFIVDSTAEGTRSVTYKTIKDSIGEVTDSKITSAKSTIDASINSVKTDTNSKIDSLNKLQTDVTYGDSEFVPSSNSMTDIDMCQEFLRYISDKISTISKKVIIVPWFRNVRGYFIGYVYPNTTQTDAGYPYHCEFEMRFGYAKTDTNSAYYSLVFGTQGGVFYSRIILDSQIVYPVGAIYITTISDSPASIFGGSWEKIEDRFLIGASTNHPVGDTGGEATHTLTVDEMPAHSHESPANTEFLFHVLNANAGQNIRISNTDTNWFKYGDLGSTGGGQPHNNLPPYYSVYIWRRIA